LSETFGLLSVWISCSSFSASAASLCFCVVEVLIKNERQEDYTGSNEIIYYVVKVAEVDSEGVVTGLPRVC